MTLPPMAGLVWISLPDPGSIESSVQSAVSPQPILALSIGMTVLPLVVAEAISMEGLYLPVRSSSMLTCASQRKFSNDGSSTM